MSSQQLFYNCQPKDYQRIDLTDLTAPILLESTPKGLMKDPRLTFDEFILYDAFLDVQRFESNDTVPAKSSIREAALSMRLGADERLNSSSFTFSISIDDDLDQAFGLPKDIEEVDLFSRFWPNKLASHYLKVRSKLFHGYQAGYHSAPQSAYAGMSEWLQIISGKLELTLIRPTKMNHIRHVDWEPQWKYHYDEGTSITYTLEPGHFIVIPTGWIVLRNAHKDSFALGGEFLHYGAIGTQIECLERDILDSDGRYSIERDCELRAIYWFTAAKLVNSFTKNDNLLRSIDIWNVECFKQTLCEWKRLSKITKVPHNLYVPDGLQSALIVKDFVLYVSRRNCGKFRIKEETQPVNVLMDQTPSNDQTN